MDPSLTLENTKRTIRQKEAVGEHRDMFKLTQRLAIWTVSDLHQDYPAERTGSPDTLTIETRNKALNVLDVAETTTHREIAQLIWLHATNAKRRTSLLLNANQNQCQKLTQLNHKPYLRLPS